ncbi:MAG: metal-sulfur cluster assembly factor [Rickettsiales bacterium]|jgi:metal-sulfur cluster biosynthetic enzyme|nr:metal-sulfur cluster assembly factor [Rickettsiales bacterium]
MKEKIIAALKTVFDPEIPVNIWDLGLVYSIEEAERGKWKIEMTMTSPTCPMSEEILQMARIAAESVVGAGNADMNLVWTPLWDISKMSAAAKIELDLTEAGW